jgi:hypothetical protein
MSNNKQNSVEWYAKQLEILADKVFKIGLTIDEFRIKKHELFEQAKAMHKKEIKNAWGNGWANGDVDIDYYESVQKQYYNETFE